MRVWCRILIELRVPGISSPGAALRGVPTSSNGPCQLLRNAGHIGKYSPARFTRVSRPGEHLGLSGGLQFRLLNPSIAKHD